MINDAQRVNMTFTPVIACLKCHFESDLSDGREENVLYLRLCMLCVLVCVCVTI